MGDNFVDDGKASVMWIAWGLLLVLAVRLR
jgi:hypothetical protein